MFLHGVLTDTNAAGIQPVFCLTPAGITLGLARRGALGAVGRAICQ